MSTKCQKLIASKTRGKSRFRLIDIFGMAMMLLIPLQSAGSAYDVGPELTECQFDLTSASGFTPAHKAQRGEWLAETYNPSTKIILAAGHVNRITGTSGYNNPPMVTFQGKKHTTEAIITKVVVPIMVETGLKRGFEVEQFIARSDNFKQAVLELARHEKTTEGIAFEIHTDVPSEGHHRASGYDGHTGVIPASDHTISHAEECVGTYMGKFKRGSRNLFAPRQGISILELFPTNKAVTEAIHYGVKTGNFDKFKAIALPYINLFYDALEQSFLEKS